VLSLSSASKDLSMVAFFRAVGHQVSMYHATMHYASIRASWRRCDYAEASHVNACPLKENIVLF